ncbi:Uncharacterized protein APZ42_013613 [Daphnia magna]|uniref:Uncharacterized protein n=1 Tax=Daphnia magna TaxID=35525 RepID=A0A162QMN0_9CRUS|nr:Uncharacterized protein APZ42_013613 [Daphnia magna]
MSAGNTKSIFSRVRKCFSKSHFKFHDISKERKQKKSTPLRTGGTQRDYIKRLAVV